MTFDKWMIAVDGIFVVKTGLGRDDWADNTYYDMWQADYTPIEAVVSTVESEYGPAGLLAMGLAGE